MMIKKLKVHAKNSCEHSEDEEIPMLPALKS